MPWLRVQAQRYAFPLRSVERQNRTGAWQDPGTAYQPRRCGVSKSGRGHCEPDAEIHIILDNLSAHKTQRVAAFLQQHPNVQLHFTPTYSSWLNQVELWFSKLQRDVIARGIFTSVADLARKLRRYINAYSKAAQPFRWKYSNPSRRIRHA